MDKRVVAIVAVVVFCFTAACLSYAADEKPVVTAPSKSPAGTVPPAMKRPAFGFLSGSLTKIDNSDPNNTNIEIKSDKDGTTHVIKITPYTNIVKITDLTELKTGETVRIMEKTTDGAESALSVTFGKIKTLPAPMPKPVEEAKKPAIPAAGK